VLLGHSGSEARVSVGSSGDGKGLALRFGRVRGGAEGWLVSRGFDSGLVFRRVSSNHLAVCLDAGSVAWVGSYSYFENGANPSIVQLYV